MTVVEASGLLGLIFGVVGTILGILNYLRDRACVQVSIKWDMSVTDNPLYDPNKFWGCIWVSNVGRRPIFISHVALRLPKGYTNTHLILREGVTGARLAEGDPTRMYIVSQDGLEQYAAHWKKVAAQVSDPSGRVWTSKQRTKNSAPSWAK